MSVNMENQTTIFVPVLASGYRLLDASSPHEEIALQLARTFHSDWDEDPGNKIVAFYIIQQNIHYPRGKGWSSHLSSIRRERFTVINGGIGEGDPNHTISEE